MRNKIIALMISLMMMTNFAIAKDGPYLGAQLSKINIDYKTVEGIDLKELYADQFNALDLHAGYNFGDSFIELAYVKSSEETKSLGSLTVGSITLSGNTKLKFDGWRIGAGHNFKINDNLSIRPFINYYDLNSTETWSVTVTGSSTLKSSASYDGSDSMVDAGLGFDYKINENSKIGLSYSRSIDELKNTNKTEIYSISYNQKF